jgi:hypothetical protein
MSPTGFHPLWDTILSQILQAVADQDDEESTKDVSSKDTPLIRRPLIEGDTVQFQSGLADVQQGSACGPIQANRNSPDSQCKTVLRSISFGSKHRYVAQSKLYDDTPEVYPIGYLKAKMDDFPDKFFRKIGLFLRVFVTVLYLCNQNAHRTSDPPPPPHTHPGQFLQEAKLSGPIL